MAVLFSFLLSSVMLFFVSYDLKNNTLAMKVMQSMGLIKEPPYGFEKWFEKIIPQSFKTQIQQDLNRLGIEETVYSYLKKKLAKGILVWTIFSVFAVLTGQVLVAVSGLICGGVVFYHSLRTLHKKADSLLIETDKQLTYLMTNISQLVLSGMPAYQAVVAGVEAIPEKSVLHRYARELISELRLGTDPGDALISLGMKLNNAYVQRYGLLIKQSHLVYGEEFMDMLVKQFDIAEEAKQNIFQKTIKLLSHQLKWPNLIMFANFVILPILFVATVIIYILTNAF